MSFGTATVDVQLDATRAEAQLTALLREIADRDAVITITADTRGVATEVTAAVDAADTNVLVTSDASEVTGEVTSAVDAADTEVLVTGDANDVTSSVTSAVDAADTDVLVEGDASAVTGAINVAVDAAGTVVSISGDASGVIGTVDATLAENSPFGPVSVDGQVSPALLTDVGTLAASLADASDEGRAFSVVLASLGAATVAAGLFQLVDAASEAEQSVGAAEAIFAEATGTITTFAATSSEAAGLTATAARNLTAQIGALLQGFGFTQEEAAKTSVAIAQLGADLAATFGGTPEEAVQALGAALRGEFDPLERFGVSLNVARANLRAVELGLADSTESVDANARAQAALSLIFEQSTGAQGQFQRELNTTAGRLAVARARAQEAAVTVGATLAPAFIELLNVVVDDVLPALTDLGTELGPALGSAVSATVPVLRGAVDVLVALTPVVETLAAVVEAIPDPVLQFVGTVLALRTALGPLGPLVTTAIQSFAGLSVAATLNVSSMGALRGGLATARDGVSSLVGSINPLTLALTAAAVGFTIYAQQQANARREAQELEAQADSLRDALNSEEGTVRGLSDLFEDLVNQSEDLQLAFLNLEAPADEVFQAAGISAQEFVDALTDTDEPLDKLITSLRESSDTMRGLDVDTQELAAQSLEELKLQATEVAAQVIKAGLATERWTGAQVEAALAANTTADGSVLLVGALEDLTEQEREAEEAAEAEAEALSEQEKALEELAATAPQVSVLLAALGDESGRTSDLLAALATATRDAGLSEQELQLILSQLGATSPQAVASLEAVADTIERVRDAGLSTLPSLEDLAGEFEEFSLEGFRDDLAQALEDIQNFNNNLVLIAEQGGPRLAAAAAQLGPQFAGEIARGIQEGRPGVADEVELLLAGIEQAGVDTESILTNQIGPDLATATGQMGTLATDAFGQNFILDPSGQIIELETDLTTAQSGVAFRAMELGTSGTSGFQDGLNFDTPTDTAVQGVSTSLEEAKPGLAFRAMELGSDTTAGFAAGFLPATPATTEIDEARTRILDAKEGMRGTASEVGTAGAEGFGAGASGMSPAGQLAGSQAIDALGFLKELARVAGSEVGAEISAGMASGITGRVASIVSSVVSAVNSAVKAAKTAAGISSPSRVFAELGNEMSAGLALGLEQGTREVSTAAAAVVDQATASVAVPVRAGLDPQVAGLLGAGAPSGVGGNLLTIGNVNVTLERGTEAEARAAGTVFVDAVELRLRQKQLALGVRTIGV